MPNNTTESTVKVWTESLGYAGRICASASTAQELVVLRAEWYRKRNPAGYGAAFITTTEDGRHFMSQNLSCD